MSEPTIAAGFARGLLELAVSKGASRQELVDRAGVDPAELLDQDNRIPFHRYVTLMRAAKELTHDPALALHFGESVDLSEMTVLPMIGNPSPMTLEGVIAQLNHYAPLGIDTGGTGERFQLLRTGRELWLVDNRPEPNAFPELTESFMAQMVCGMRRWSYDARFVQAIHVTHREPAYLAEYERIFQMPVVFDSDKNAMLLFEDAWEVPTPPFAPRYASEILIAHADALLEKLESSKTVRGQVEKAVIPLLHTGEVSMELIAGKIGLTRQTLFRKLKAEGVTFGMVLNALREKLAVHYLSEKNISVGEAGYLVGFSDPAAFSRAFKRWTGVSPRTLKKRAEPR